MPELETSIVWLGAIAGALSSIAALLSLAFKPFLKLKERVKVLEDEIRTLKEELAGTRTNSTKTITAFCCSRM